MKREPPTVEDLEAFSDQLEGPLGVALRETGAIIQKRMRERGQAWADLDDRQVVEVFLTAFMEAAPRAYPHKNPADVERAVAAMVQGVWMEIAATAVSSPSVN